MRLLYRALSVLLAILFFPLRRARITDNRSPFIGLGESTGDWRRFLGPIRWVGINTAWTGWELNWLWGPAQLRIGTWQSAIWWRSRLLAARYGLRRRQAMFPGSHFVGWEWRMPFTNAIHARGQEITIVEIAGSPAARAIPGGTWIGQRITMSNLPTASAMPKAADDSGGRRYPP